MPFGGLFNKKRIKTTTTTTTTMDESNKVQITSEENLDEYFKRVHKETLYKYNSKNYVEPVVLRSVIIRQIEYFSKHNPYLLESIFRSVLGGLNNSHGVFHCPNGDYSCKTEFWKIYWRVSDGSVIFTDWKEFLKEIIEHVNHQTMQGFKSNRIIDKLFSEIKKKYKLLVEIKKRQRIE